MLYTIHSLNCSSCGRDENERRREKKIKVTLNATLKGNFKTNVIYSVERNVSYKPDPLK